MGQRSNYAAKRVAKILPSEEEFATDMGQRSSDAAMMGALIMP